MPLPDDFKYEEREYISESKCACEVKLSYPICSYSR